MTSWTAVLPFGGVVTFVGFPEATVRTYASGATCVFVPLVFSEECGLDEIVSVTPTLLQTQVVRGHNSWPVIRCTSYEIFSRAQKAMGAYSETECVLANQQAQEIDTRCTSSRYLGGGSGTSRLSL